MKPSGTVQIDKETYEAVADGVFVDEGTIVSVIGVRGNYLVVRKYLL
jgi:membrane-bound ClpP family serine protease